MRVGKLAALAFFPLDRIEDGFGLLWREFIDEEQATVAYF